MADTTAARERYYDWMGKCLKIMLGFLPTGAVGICYAFKSTKLYYGDCHAHIYYMAWYSGIEFALAFLGKALREVGGSAFLSTIVRFHVNLYQIKKQKEQEERLRRQLQDAIAHSNPVFLQQPQQYPYITPPTNHQDGDEENSLPNNEAPPRQTTTSKDMRESSYINESADVNSSLEDIV
uniref:Uncharacterized protein n=1 Tax=Tanacetum cinerariifolium TaxID=118510 RepID=A0A699IVB5_TANCI|nr:hypothetical protein [Tanacetum cinerariifolium]